MASNPLTKANRHAKLAEEHAQAQRWEEAKLNHFQAAEEFLNAMKTQTDEMNAKAFRTLSVTHTRKANEIKKMMERKQSSHLTQNSDTHRPDDAKSTHRAAGGQGAPTLSQREARKPQFGRGNIDYEVEEEAQQGKLAGGISLVAKDDYMTAEEGGSAPPAKGHVVRQTPPTTTPTATTPITPTATPTAAPVATTSPNKARTSVEPPFPPNSPSQRPTVSHSRTHQTTSASSTPSGDKALGSLKVGFGKAFAGALQKVSDILPSQKWIQPVMSDEMEDELSRDMSNVGSPFLGDSFCLVPGVGNGTQGSKAVSRTPANNTAGSSTTRPEINLPEDLSPTVLRTQLINSMKTIDLLGSENANLVRQSEQLKREVHLLKITNQKLKMDVDKQNKYYNRVVEDLKRKEERLIASQYAANMKAKKAQQSKSSEELKNIPVADPPTSTSNVSAQPQEPFDDALRGGQVEKELSEYKALADERLKAITELQSALDNERHLRERDAKIIEAYKKQWNDLKSRARQKRTGGNDSSSQSLDDASSSTPSAAVTKPQEAALGVKDIPAVQALKTVIEASPESSPSSSSSQIGSLERGSETVVGGDGERGEEDEGNPISSVTDAVDEGSVSTNFHQDDALGVQVAPAHSGVGEILDNMLGNLTTSSASVATSLDASVDFATPSSSMYFSMSGADSTDTSPN